MTVSFLHSGGPHMASYRYRVLIPSRELGWPINTPESDVLIFSKPIPSDVALAHTAQQRGSLIVVDVCDAHLHYQHYRDLIRMADAVTVPTPFLASLIHEDCGVPATVIDDPYEFPERAPHVQGANMLWFGHPTNYYSLEPYLPALKAYDLQIMTNRPGCLPWSVEGLQEELARADIVILPETAPHKSANRAIEAIRSGCFVVAEPHPSLNDIPGLWTGDLLKGIEWVRQNPSLSNERLTQSQAYVRARHTPERVANAWKTLVTGLRSSSAVGTSPGMVGSTSTANAAPATPILSLI